MFKYAAELPHTLQNVHFTLTGAGEHRLERLIDFILLTLGSVCISSHPSISLWSSETQTQIETTHCEFQCLPEMKALFHDTVF